jgi:hypothetical protein
MTATAQPIASASATASFSARRPQLASDQQHRFLFPAQEFGGGGDRGLQRLGVAWLLLDDGADRPRRRTGGRRDVARDLDVSRLPFAQGRADRVIDLVGRIHRGRDGNRGASEPFGIFQLVRKVVRTERMVQPVLGRPVVRVGRPGHKDDRQVFGKGPPIALNAESAPTLKLTTAAAVPRARA